MQLAARHEEYVEMATYALGDIVGKLERIADTLAKLERHLAPPFAIKDVDRI
jgi:hypothetical protein